MTSYRNKTGSTARNAPFGTDIQPKRNMRIVGGKQIEIAVDSPPSSATSSQRSLPPLQQGPNGTPPMVMQPPVQEFNNNKQHLEYSEKQERIIQSQTAPADKSNSHIHGTRGRYNSLPGSHAVLPPIPSPNSLSPSSRHSWHVPRSPSPSPSPSPTLQLVQPELNLTDQLQRLLADYDPYCFQDMYKDLAECDRKLSGYVSQPQVNMVALRHQLPLPTNTMRLLFSSFSKDNNIDLVNYERLIQYLARAQLGTAEAQTLLEESVNRFVNASDLTPTDEVSLDEQISKYETAAKKQHRRHRPKHPESSRVNLEKSIVQTARHEQTQRLEAENEPQDTAKKPQQVFSDRQDAKLLMLLEQQYIQGNQEPTDLNAMKRDFKDRDKNRLGTLTKEQVQEVCFKHRIPVQGSIMDKLLHRCKAGNDRFSWVAFLDFLGRVKPLASAGPDSEVSHQEPGRPSTWPKQRGDGLPEAAKKAVSPGLPQEPRPPPWETRKPLGRLGVPSPTSVEREITQYDSPSPTHDSPPPVAHAPRGGNKISDVQRAELTAMATRHKVQREAAKVRVQPKAKDNDEPWFVRFKHLAQGLYNLDGTNVGYLSKEETRSLVNNYNLIYNLGLEQSHIDKCVAGCCLSQGRVSIEHLLEALTLRLN